MEIVQKKGSVKHIFIFNEEKVNFAYEGKTGSGDSDIYYGHVPLKSSIQIEENSWLRNVGYLWIVLGVIQLGLALFSGTTLAGKSFWLLLGLGCIGWAKYSKIKYTVLKCESANIFVIQDSKHDEIISELKSCRKKQLLNWYGELNLQNDKTTEINKFNWLREQQVLSAEEVDSKIAQVELAFENDQGASPTTIN